MPARLPTLAACPATPPRSLKAITRLRQNTSLIALLQPTPETLELFDDILVSAACALSGCTPLGWPELQLDPYWSTKAELELECPVKFRGSCGCLAEGSAAQFS